MNDLDDVKPNIQIEIKAIKKLRRSRQGIITVDVWKPETEWIHKYQKIGYKGNPLDKTVQQKVHNIYNSIEPSLQDEWLEKTKGLGWCDKYIKIALTYWNKQTKYINKDEEAVKEYLTTLTEIERENFKDICEVFCPENPYIHIKSSCGFLEYQENKDKINKYLQQISVEDKDYLNDITDDMNWAQKYNHILKSTEFQDFCNSK